jgi:hypothetical protein
VRSDLNQLEAELLRRYCDAGLPTPLGHPVRRLFAACRFAMRAIVDGRIQHFSGRWFIAKDEELLRITSRAWDAIRIRSGRVECRLTKIINARSALHIAADGGGTEGTTRPSAACGRHRGPPKLDRRRPAAEHAFLRDRQLPRPLARN